MAAVSLKKIWIGPDVLLPEAPDSVQVAVKDQHREKKKLPYELCNSFRLKDLSHTSPR
jgi:hypothetical protein